MLCWLKRRSAGWGFAMAGKAGPGADLRRFMEKRLDLKLNANRHVIGTLRGSSRASSFIFSALLFDRASEEHLEIDHKSD